MVTSYEERVSLVQDDDLKEMIKGIARKFYRGRFMRPNLQNAGMLAAWLASEKFDSSRGVKFTTYAHPFIYRAIADAVREGANVISIPRDTYQNAGNLLNGSVSTGAEVQLGESSEAKEKGRVTRCVALAAQARCVASYEADGTEFGGDMHRSYADITADQTEDACPPPEQMEKLEQLECLKAALGHLSENERNFIIDRYGLYGHPKLSGKELSAKWNCTESNCTQTVKRGMKKLKDYLSRER